MKRKPHSRIRPSAWGCVLVLAALLAPAASAQDQASAKKEAAREVLSGRAAPAPPDAAMTLRNPVGQEIEARLLSAHGEMVRIERIDNGRVFLVPIDSFDEYTGERIRSWMDRAPEAIEYSLAFTATKSLVNSTTFMSSGRDLKTSEWSYRVTVTNLTRNALAGAQLEYRLVFDDNVDIARAVVAPGKGADQQDGQMVDLPDLAFNDQVEFDTVPLQLHTYEYVPSRGEREYARDTLKGIWIRVVKNGKTIGEFQSSPSSLGGLSWDNEDKIEIRVTNRFRDRLGADLKK